MLLAWMLVATVLQMLGIPASPALAQRKSRLINMYPEAVQQVLIARALRHSSSKLVWILVSALIYLSILALGKAGQGCTLFEFVLTWKQIADTLVIMTYMQSDEGKHEFALELQMLSDSRKIEDLIQTLEKDW